MIITYGAMALDHLLFGYSFEDVATPMAVITMLGIVIPSTSVAARRLHDIGWTGWLQLPVFMTYSAYLEIWIPEFSTGIIGISLMTVGTLAWIILLVLCIKDSQSTPNKYGTNPKSPDMGEVFS